MSKWYWSDGGKRLYRFDPATSRHLDQLLASGTSEYMVIPTFGATPVYVSPSLGYLQYGLRQLRILIR